MENHYTYLETNSHNPYYNLAFEEIVFTSKTEGDYLILWQNDRTVVVGRNQNTEAEINHSFVERHGINIVRRTTGGGAVYHDLGNLNYSFITTADNQKGPDMQRFIAPVVEALQKLGVEAEASGRNDILIEGRKVSGTAQRISHNRILHHGTLLFDSSPEWIAGALQVDKAKFESKGIQSVCSRVGNIRDFLTADMDLSTFWQYIKGALSKQGAIDGSLSKEELKAVEKLQFEKYQTWEWNFGKSPSYNVTNKRRFAGGIIEPKVLVEKGCITEITFYGDFAGVYPAETVALALKGCLFRKEAVVSVFNRFDMKDYFGLITGEEIADTIFNTF